MWHLDIRLIFTGTDNPIYLYIQGNQWTFYIPSLKHAYKLYKCSFVYILVEVSSSSLHDDKCVQSGTISKPQHEIMVILKKVIFVFPCDLDKFIKSLWDKINCINYFFLFTYIGLAIYLFPFIIWFKTILKVTIKIWQ